MNIRKLSVGPLTALLLISFFFYKYFYFKSFSGFFGGSDTDNYLSHFGELSMITDFRVDYLYYAISYVFSLIVSFDFFLALTGLLFFYSIVKTVSKLVGPTKWLPFFLLASFFYPAYISVSELVIRQGIGFAVLFISSFYLSSTTLKKRLASIFIASLFHSGFLFYLLIIWINRKLITNLRTGIFAWIVVSFLYSLDIFTYIVEFLPNFDYLAGSLDAYVEAEYVVGFKLNFLLLSALPIALLIFPGFSRYIKQDGNKEGIYILFFTTNLCGMLFSGFGYYDRVMLFSWVIIPIITFFFIYWLFCIRKKIVLV